MQLAENYVYTRLFLQFALRFLHESFLFDTRTLMHGLSDRACLVKRLNLKGILAPIRFHQLCLCPNLHTNGRSRYMANLHVHAYGSQFLWQRTCRMVYRIGQIAVILYGMLCIVLCLTYQYKRRSIYAYSVEYPAYPSQHPPV